MDKSRRMEARKVFETWNPSMHEKLDQYVRLFPEQFAKFADSERANIKGLKEHDLYALGRTLEQQTMLKPMTEEVSFSQLGAAPTLAYDFITAFKSTRPFSSNGMFQTCTP